MIGLGIKLTNSTPRGFTLGSNLVVGGNFSSSSGWNLGLAWTIALGVASHANTAASSIWRSQPLLEDNVAYLVEYDVLGYASGNVAAQVGNLTLGQFRSANGHYSEVIIKKGDDTVALAGDAAFVGSVDNFSVRKLLPLS